MPYISSIQGKAMILSGLDEKSVFLGYVLLICIIGIYSLQKVVVVMIKNIKLTLHEIANN